MIKIVWITTMFFSSQKENGTGTWIRPLANALISTGKVEIYNFTYSNNYIESPKRSDSGSVKQWLFPRVRNKDIRLLGKQVETILNTIHPDIVHIWGTESNWSSLYLHGYIKYPCFIDMQGILSSYYYFYRDCLPLKEKLKVIFNSREFLNFRNSFLYALLEFKKGGIREKRALRKFKHISVQSEFTKSEIQRINPNAKLYKTNIILRDEFYKSSQWKFKNNSVPVIFTCASHVQIPYKGLYILVKAMGILKHKYPTILLKIAGEAPDWNKPKNGYIDLLRRLINDNELWNNIVFLGKQTSIQLVENLQQCNVCVVPSFVETYCLAAAEALMVGTPCVISNAAALPELALDEKEALFYSPMDYNSLSTKIERLIEEKNTAELISSASRKRRFIENNVEKIVNNQLDIYKEIIRRFNNE